MEERGVLWSSESEFYGPVFQGFGLRSISTAPPRVELVLLLQPTSLPSASVCSIFPWTLTPVDYGFFPLWSEMGREDQARVQCISFAQAEISFLNCLLRMSFILEIRSLLQKKGLWGFRNDCFSLLPVWATQRAFSHLPMKIWCCSRRKSLKKCRGPLWQQPLGVLIFPSL